MSVSAVSSSNSLSQSLQAWQSRAQKIQTEFQQLGQDLQAGNLGQAQSDYSSLSQNFSSTMLQNRPVPQDFAALGTALQSGNLAAAQTAYSTLQQDAQQKSQPARGNALGGLANFATSSLSQAFQSYMLGPGGTALTLAQGLSALA
jgi:Skp family chaperone for outer membrane proteins